MLGLPTRFLLVVVLFAAVFPRQLLAADGNLPGGTAISVDIVAPPGGATVQSADELIPVQAAAAIGEGIADPDTLLVYVLDVSGSTNQPGTACGGDVNGDGLADTVLDCEIAAALALNADAVAAGSVGEVAVITFSGDAATSTSGSLTAVAGDVHPDPGVQTVTAPATDAGGQLGPDVEEVLRSAISQNVEAAPRYGLRRFTPLASGRGFTNYYDAVQVALDLARSSARSNKLIVFLSDGDNTSGGQVAALEEAVLASGALFHTFAVGSNTGFSCATDDTGRGSLLDVARLSEPDGTCTEVADVASLPAVVPELIRSTLTQLTVAVDGTPVDAAGLTVDPALPQVGPATVALAGAIAVPSVGPHELCVTARGVDAGGSGAVTDCVNLVVNGPPAAADDLYSLQEDSTLTVTAPGILGNDGDPNGEPLAIQVVDQPARGRVAVAPDGAFTYAPDRHFEGMDTFTYTLSDPSGAVSTLATVTITVTPDAYLEVTNQCPAGPGSLTAALERANADAGINTIIFDLLDGQCGNDGVIALTAPLPPIADPVVIDGNLADDGTDREQTIVLDGAGILSQVPVDGLSITQSGAGSTIRGITIRHFSGSGIVIGAPEAPSSGSVIANTEIAGNGGDGITVLAGTDNRFTDNDIYGNGDQSIDLNGDGRTENDAGDADEGANLTQNFPVLFRAVPTGPDTLLVEGWLGSVPSAGYTIQLFAGPRCDAESEARLPVAAGTDSLTTNERGETYFQTTVIRPVPFDWAVRATATDAAGNTSEMSDCILVSIDNDSWPRALDLAESAGVLGAAAGENLQMWSIEQYLDQAGQDRWYRFAVQPDSIVQVTLDNLPANYDIVLYKDIRQVFDELTAPANEDDLHRLSAEFAPSAFSPSAFSPSAFSPSAFSPSAFSPSAFSPSAFSPAAFSPSAFSPSAFSPSAFSSAQMRSLVAVSATDGTAGEQLLANTWTNTGDFYVRVRGREGVFSLDAPFRLAVTVQGNGCDVAPLAELPATSLPDLATAGEETLIVVDRQRMAARYGETAMQSLEDQLAALAARTNGVVVDVSADARVAAANTLADGAALVGCPYAKNVVADAVKRVIDVQQAGSPELRYLVIVGNDDVIPFFRYPDTALLGDESNYFPPVEDLTASQASLRRSYVLSQDAYGADVTLSRNGTTLPIPRRAVGRLVETPSDMAAQIDAFLSTAGGVVPTPSSALVTGYDFLEDAALAVQRELQAGLAQGARIDSLITPADVSPRDLTLAEGGQVWTAADLGARLTENRYELAFLAGHFNANSALAADYETSLISTDLLNAAVDLTNMIVFSVGCHSGYNIVNEHGIPGVTFEPDWPQVFAQRGATLIAGTGYQYGDTDFLEYSERLYLNFIQELRTGTGPVAVGDALMRAKQRYLETTPALRGIHEKSLLEATLFGLPMLSVDMPGERIISDPDLLAIATPVPVGENPGALLGLHTTELSISPGFQTRVTELTNIDPDEQNSSPVITARWLAGTDGVVTNPAEPVLPLEIRNVAAPQPGLVLRGVALREAQYTDIFELFPLTGAPTTEIRGVHSPFLSDVFFPLRPWSVNYFGELTGPPGRTTLMVTPAQHRSTHPGSQTSTLRRYDQLGLQLFYSGEVDDDAGETGSPGASAPPTIAGVRATVSDENVITFAVRAVGNPAAGMQSVWVTYTGLPGSSQYGRWQSLDLVQSAEESTLWRGTLSLPPTEIANLRFIVQAVNGVGLVGVADNLGRYYRPGGANAVTTTGLTLQPYRAGGPFGTEAEFVATLRGATGAALANQVVYIALGVQERLAFTDEEGTARIKIPLLSQPGSYAVRAFFPGTVELAAASAVGPDEFVITPQVTTLCFDLDLDNECDTQPDTVEGTNGALLLAAILNDGNLLPRRQPEQSLFFELTSGDRRVILPAITDFSGRAVVTVPELAPGVYDVVVRYSGTETLEASTSIVVVATVVEADRGPNCADAVPNPASIWPPNNQFTWVTIDGITDPDGDPVSLAIDAVCQDEPVSRQGDARIQGEAVELRAARQGKGNGRAYQVDFTAMDSTGNSCQGSVVVVVPHDRRGRPVNAADDMQYNSLDRRAPVACRALPNVYGAGMQGYTVLLPFVTNR